MRALIVHCHPEPKSFNSALTNVTLQTLKEQGYVVEKSDLYEDGFDPVERPDHYDNRADCEHFSALNEQRHANKCGALPTDVAREIHKLERADLIIFQFPLWWHAQPAMLKGWFDRVFIYGGLYSSTMRFDRGQLLGRRAICSVTTGAPEETFGAHGRSGDITLLLWPILRSLHYVGLDVLAPHVTYGVKDGRLDDRGGSLFTDSLQEETHRWRNRLERLNDDQPIPFSGWNDWNTQGVVKADSPKRWQL